MRSPSSPALSFVQVEGKHVTHGGEDLNERETRPHPEGVPRPRFLPVRFLHRGMLMSCIALLNENPTPHTKRSKRASKEICAAAQDTTVSSALLNRWQKAIPARRDDDKYSVINTHVHNVDGIAKVTGRARYTFDVKLPGMLYGKILRSPHPSAKILNIDYSRAMELSRVIGVVTGKDTLGVSRASGVTPGRLRSADPSCRQSPLRR